MPFLRPARVWLGKETIRIGASILVEEAFAGAAFNLFEAGQCFEEEGDVGGGCAHVVEGVALCGSAGVAHEVEEAVEEVDLVGEDVEDEVRHFGREWHPGTG